MTKKKPSVKNAKAKLTDFDFAITAKKMKEKMLSVTPNEMVEVLKNQDFWENLFESVKYSDNDPFKNLMEKLQIKSFTDIYLEDKLSKELLTENEVQNYEFDYHRIGSFLPAGEYCKIVAFDGEIKKLFIDNLIKHILKEEKKENEKVEKVDFDKSFYLKQMEMRSKIEPKLNKIDYDATLKPSDKIERKNWNVLKNAITKIFKTHHFWYCLFEFEKDTDLFDFLLDDLLVCLDLGSYFEEKFMDELLDETEKRKYGWNYHCCELRFKKSKKMVLNDSEIRKIFSHHLTIHLLNYEWKILAYTV